MHLHHDCKLFYTILGGFFLNLCKTRDCHSITPTAKVWTVRYNKDSNPNYDEVFANADH